MFPSMRVRSHAGAFLASIVGLSDRALAIWMAIATGVKTVETTPPDCPRCSLGSPLRLLGHILTRPLRVCGKAPSSKLKPPRMQLLSMTSYSSQFNQEIRRRLESLRGQLDEDLPKIEDLALNLTFGQADELLSGIDSALESHRDAMQPLYRTERRSRSGSSGGSSYSQRRREREQLIAKLADESVEKQGYVIAAAISAETEYRDPTVTTVLDQLAAEHGWDRRQDRETKSPRYTPLPGPQHEESTSA